MLRTIINHEFLARTIYPEASRSLYASLEGLLSWDFQYWLQRGSLEVEFGSVALAENFLGQARALAPDDPFVLTEWSYLLFSKAQEQPHAVAAPELAAQASDILEELIDRPGNNDPYPYHVLGSQGLRWARRGIDGRSEKERYLNKLLTIVQAGRNKFPRAADLEQLWKDLKKESLGLIVAANASTSPT